MLPIGTSSKEPKQLAFPPQSLWQKAGRVSSHAPTSGSRVPKLRISVLFLPRPARLILPGEGKAGEKEWVGKGQGHPTSASVRGPPKSTNFLPLSATTSVESKHRAGLCRHQDTYKRPAMRFSCILGNVVFCQLWAVSEEAWWEPGLERAELPEEWLSRLGLQCLVFSSSPASSMVLSVVRANFNPGYLLLHWREDDWSVFPGSF